MKNERRHKYEKMLSLFLALALMLSISMPSMAAEVSSDEQFMDSGAVAYLEAFLSNLKAGHIEEAFTMLEDNRMVLREDIDYASLSASAVEYIEYVESGNAFKNDYEDEAILNYKILSAGQTPNTILTKLYFVDGSDAIVPFDVIPTNDGYKICISEDDLYDKGYEEGTVVEADIIEDSSVSPCYSGFQFLDEYEFWDLYGSIYGIDTFNITKQVIRITGQQWNNEIDKGYVAKAEVIYKIVVKHWYGDTVWGTTTNAVVKNGYFTVYLQGKNADTSNARIKIENTTGYMPLSKGSGSVYQCDQ